MKSSIAEVTEEHLVLVLGLVATHALLAVGTLPLVAGHKLGEKYLVILSEAERLIITWMRSRLRPIQVG